MEFVEVSNCENVSEDQSREFPARSSAKHDRTDFNRFQKQSTQIFLLQLFI